MPSSIPSLHSSATVAAPEAGKPKDAADAARQFEALMIGEMLRSAREAESDEEKDSTGSTMLDMADQQFAKMLADHGGLGLATMIAKSLKAVDTALMPNSP